MSCGGVKSDSHPSKLRPHCAGTSVSVPLTEAPVSLEPCKVFLEMILMYRLLYFLYIYKAAFKTLVYLVIFGLFTCIKLIFVRRMTLQSNNEPLIHECFSNLVAYCGKKIKCFSCRFGRQTHKTVAVSPIFNHLSNQTVKMHRSTRNFLTVWSVALQFFSLRQRTSCTSHKYSVFSSQKYVISVFGEAESSPSTCFYFP